jgi:hypothetical protein
MPQENLNQEPDSASEDNQSLLNRVDLTELAEKIAALLLKEISIETERTGR